MSLTFPPAPSSVLALVTTFHLALASLRNHRRPDAGPLSSLALVGVLLAGTPWLLPSHGGLFVGILLHAVWFVVCERWTPGAVDRPRKLSVPAPPMSAARPASRSPEATAPSPVAVRPKGFVETNVLAVFDETPEIRTFRFRRPDGFDFRAGQFLTIRLRVGGREVVRCYSISSSPSTPGYLEISVKRQGLVSNTLHSTLRPGARVSVRAPAGVFTYPDADDRPLLLLAGGIGITPLFSMLRHAVAADPHRPVALLYAARHEKALAFRRDLALIAARHPQVKVVLAASEATDPGVFSGHLDEHLIRTAVPDFQSAIAMVCGPQPMIDGMRTLLVGMGMPADDVRSEIFEAAVAAAGTADHALPVAAAHDAVTHTMRCARGGREVPVAAGQSILDAAEAAGVSIDSLCRAGVCGTCRTKVLDGHVDCESTMLDDRDRDQGFVLACVSRVQSDCVVEV